MAMLDRRSFLAMAGAAGAAVPALSALRAGAQQPNAQVVKGVPPMAISSGNGLRAVEKAVELMRGDTDPLDAIVAGINIVEDDPKDNSVGYGGLPNEDGIVELDSSCLHGPSHKAGAVAGLRNIRNPSSVALQVLRQTDHALLVGAGALKFAVRLGFKEENLLTEESRQAWLKWKANLNRDDDWLNDDQQIPAGPRGNMNTMQSRARELGVPFTTGTIHVSALNEKSDLSACTSTSGLSWKLPGRVGDSPIVGAGMFCDNTVGSAGATGRGEAVIQSCGSFQIVQHMARGLAPTEACLKALQWIADHTRQKYLLDDKGRPNFEVTFYPAHGRSVRQRAISTGWHIRDPRWDDGASRKMRSAVRRVSRERFTTEITEHTERSQERHARFVSPDVLFPPPCSP
jgi:N4-(beta-N-acetylglucosaminyl)-L-asparaginase